MPDGVEGDCTLIAKEGKSPRFAIRIDNKLSVDAQFYVLLHEWAHALSWGSESHRIRFHGPEWGLAMSRIWQSLLED
jgi:predicted SprT family Zn-dependent metalloprotease